MAACDRENPKMSNRYDTLSPSSLGMLRFIVEKCSAGNVPLTLCGEIGGEKVGALALLAIGFRRLSIAPAAVGPVKMMINSLNLGDVERFSDKLLSLSDPSLRSNFEVFARDNDVSI